MFHVDLITLFTTATLIAVASYLQTLTGFAFGLVFMVGVALTNVLTLSDGALITIFLFLVNVVQYLREEANQISAVAYWRIVPIAIVFAIAGTLLLPVLMANSIMWLRVALGVAIIGSSLTLLRMPVNACGSSSTFAFSVSGVLCGLMGGLFALPGPPVVYTLLRHIKSHRQVRATLVAILGTIGVIRVVVCLYSDPPTADILLLTALLVPVVVLFTALARLYPPPLSSNTMRIITIALLVLSGAMLLLPAMSTLVHAVQP